MSAQTKITAAAKEQGWSVELIGGNFAAIRRGDDELRVKFTSIGSVSWADISVDLKPTSECRASLPPRFPAKAEMILIWLRDGAPKECW